jgi:hypothetical protein
MATSSTLRLVHPEIDLAREAEIHESRLRRLFRRRARRRRAALVPGWREEAIVRSMRAG